MIEFKIPEVGEGISSGTVVSILVKPGDTIEKDQAVLELETDKAVVEIPSDVSGTITEILVKENQEVNIGQAVLKLSESEASAKKAEKVEPEQNKETKPIETKPIETKQTVNETKDKVVETSGLGSSQSKDLIPAAPSVRRIAREMGIDIHQIQGSGILGRISV
ncbi:MAG TPA: biotin/lipoyl-binding protein, partial [Trueperaceae bacterium]|nr:biotin/lipoyl-binding protein [Trueperaceae bacterium]